MRYVYRCPECERRVEVERPIKDADLPEFCYHNFKARSSTSFAVEVVKMVKVPQRFNFTANREVDKPENDYYRVLGARDAGERLAAARAEEKQAEAKAAEAAKFAPKPDLEQSSWLDGCDVNGAWTAAHAGPEQLERWRNDNIPKDDFAETANAS